MNSILKQFLENILKQGFSISIMAVAIVYFHFQVSNLQTENKGLVQQIENIQTDIVSKYHDDNKEMVRVIERNTETINNILEK